MLADFYQVLIVHPDPLLRFSAAQWLRGRGIRSVLVSTPQEAARVLRRRPIDLVVATLSDTDTGWFELVEAMPRLKRPPPVIVATSLMLPTWLTPGIQPYMIQRAQPPQTFLELVDIVDKALQHRLVA